MAHSGTLHLSDAIMTNSTSPSSQLEQLLAGSAELLVGSKTFIVDKLRHEEGLGFFASFRTPRADYLAMQTSARVIGKPDAEVWTVISTSGRGRTIADFAISHGKVLVLG